ncbi:hypothetical protein LCGC14_0237580 [marine sediment metagenome]|jgi:hypothetical protein|uniref:Uncharacterized protein n=1 Tax=marine sediment metagenome TaxID=412755 RepID=A0A0F9WTK0_9ZZZZ|nr:hypothetical protein [Halopseudomonas aestusnigri]MDL2200890.1 hypothetical protein [Halopseudomonas aestusnigri]UGV30045.1 hypothetical protein LO767_13755 [Halopseudomonas aestusnigri]|tara:strand:- start:32 stop:424 length:393 start_codon:yes stop_codon:yes gene_type:complete
MAITQKYLERKRTNVSTPETRDWFHHCTSNGLPYVEVRNLKSNIGVHWDHITLSLSAEERFLARYTEFRAGVEAIVKRWGSDASEWQVSQWTVWIWKLDLDSARNAACELYDLGVLGIFRPNATFRLLSD